ncbi:MAG TPA: glycosyltransferase [Rhodopila sp.]|jgi:glycosyltransferase involved in cell wall biosynthesis
MHISVVVPAFNVAAFLPDLLVSVLGQTHADWSLVVVDDGSTDDTVAIASGQPDRRIRVVRQGNAGVSAARNTGIQLALANKSNDPAQGAGDGVTASGLTGDHEIFADRDRSGQATRTSKQPDAFLFLDGDDWLAPEALGLLAEALDDAPWAVAAVGRFAWVGLNAAARISPPPPCGCVLERLLTRNLFANGGHLLVRREAVAAAGDFRIDLSYGEDWEYWARLALQGEFAAVRSRAPLLFVRERLAGAYLSRATDPDAYRPVLDALYRNPAFATRLGTGRLSALRRRADAEVAWTLGRELIKHGRRREGLRWIARSICAAPASERILLGTLACLRLGPFRPYITGR